MKFVQTGRGRRRGRRVKSNKIINSIRTQLGTGRRRKRKSGIRKRRRRKNIISLFH